jgi:urease accessory protein
MPRVRRPAARPRTATSAPTLLALMWLASPALPIGGFSYSEALEAAVDAGLVTHEATARDWLLDQLVLGLACSELAVVARAFGAWRRHDAARAQELNAWVLATRETAEQRLQTEQMGRSLAAWLAQRQADPAHGGGTDGERAAASLAALLAFAPAPTYPLAFALAAAGTACSAREAVLAAGFGWAENMVQAAVRAVPLGQSAGQRILGALADALPAAVDHALALGDGERLASLPGLAILGARHETQYSRLFRS